jgi:hypothetical protein
VNAVLAALQGFTVSTIALLALFLGFCLVFTLPKLRRGGARSRVPRGLEEAAGLRQIYLSPAAPHGTVDQLRTPELLETEARKSA